MQAILNHPHQNEVQTVSQIFFPNSRFTVIDAQPTAAAQLTGWVVVSLLGKYDATALVYRDGKRLSIRRWPLNESRFISDKRALMLALFNALKEAADVYTPWGSLTGIRPSKLVRQWMDEGLTDGEIIAMLDEPFGCQRNKARLAVQVAHAEKRLTAQVYDAITPGKTFERSLSYMASPVEPVGLYVSIPFCPSRCLYCSFNMGQSYSDDAQYARYLDAVERDCERKAQMLKDIGGVLTSVYIGGGTPTVLNTRLLDRLLSLVDKYFNLRAAGMEYTVEAGRPDSLTADKLRLLASRGVNRIAVNPQTLNDKTLKRIGRSHTAADFFNAYERARGVGFNAVNTDIIVGLPGETLEDVRRTMDGLIALKPENITVHTLAVKRASRLNENLNDFTFAEAVELEAMLETARMSCECAGLSPYYLYRQKNMVGHFENTGYSLPGRECLYNVGMMAETQTVLGVGAGAVCKFVDGTKIEREYSVKNPDIYTERMLNL
jgi:oxygen-independent coproporphyrinogen-3 oxidase